MNELGGASVGKKLSINQKWVAWEVRGEGTNYLTTHCNGVGYLPMQFGDGLNVQKEMQKLDIVIFLLHWKLMGECSFLSMVAAPMQTLPSNQRCCFLIKVKFNLKFV